MCLSPKECLSNACTGIVCGECDEDSDCGANQFCNALNVCVDQAGVGEFCTVPKACTTGACYAAKCGECDESTATASRTSTAP